MAHAVDRIHQVGADSKNAYTYYPVVIVGAGESGICIGCKLQSKLDCDQFRIFDRRSGLGGTWYANRYPGIACDIPAMVYSYSFAQNPKWTQTYPTGQEIVSYLYDVCADYKLLDKIQCDTNVKSVRWLEHVKEWEVILEHLMPGSGDMSTAERRRFEKENPEKPVVLKEEMIRAKVVVSAVGGLVEPKEPIDLPGRDQFAGKIVHTARWDEKVELKDKNVVVIGTGCSAAQVVTALSKPEAGVKQITQLMRSPPWTTPSFSPEEKQAFKETMPFRCTYIPGYQRVMRKIIYATVESEWFLLFAPTEAARQRRQEKRKELLDYMHRMVPEKYHRILTPDYEVFCKRRVIDDGWFASLQQENVELTARKPKKLGPRHLTLSDELSYPVGEKDPSGQDRDIPCDVLVMANGYQTNEWIHPLDVMGRDGQLLSQVWKKQGGAGGYLGAAMHGFPNFFIVFGPNTATGHSSVILASEVMSDYALNFIGPLLRGDTQMAEIKEAAERAYTAEVQRSLKTSVYNSGGAKNWYVSDGWNSTTYPRSQVDFWLRCHLPRFRHWDLTYTSKGLVKLWLGVGLRAALLAALINGYRKGRLQFNLQLNQYRLHVPDWQVLVSGLVVLTRGLIKYI